MEHNKIFTKRFDKLRGSRSNTEFAAFLGLSRQTVGFYLNGERVPDFNSLIIIAQKCQVPVDYLLGLSDTKSYDADLQAVCKYTGLSGEAVERLHEPDTTLPLHTLINLMLSDYSVEYTEDALKNFLTAKICYENHLRARDRELYEGIDAPPEMTIHGDGTVTLNAEKAYSFYLNMAADDIKLLMDNAIWRDE